MEDEAARATPGDGRSGRRLLTLPNAITVGRLLLVPGFAWLLLRRQAPVAAAALLGVLGATDFVDGWLARRLNQVSTVGKVLDPVADRVLLVTAGVVTLVAGDLPRGLAAAVLAREVVVSVGVGALALAGAERVDVLWVGKAGTFALMTAFPFFIVGHAPVSGHAAALAVARALAGAGLALSWTAAFAYVGPARRALAQGRGGRLAAWPPGASPPPDDGRPGTPRLLASPRPNAPPPGRPRPTPWLTAD